MERKKIDLLSQNSVLVYKDNWRFLVLDWYSLGPKAFLIWRGQTAGNGHSWNLTGLHFQETLNLLSYGSGIIEQKTDASLEVPSIFLIQLEIFVVSA